MKKIFRINIVVFLLITFFFVVSNCKKVEETIKIGAIYPLTGPLASIGKGSLNGLILAAEDINATGGINGIKIEIIAEDGRGEPATSVSAAKKLIDFNRVKYVISLHSSVSLAILPITKEKGVLLISEATHPSISNQGPLVFRNALTAIQEARLIVNKITDLGDKQIAMIYQNDDYGHTLRDNITENIANLTEPVKLIASEAYEKTETSFQSILAKILAYNPQGIFIGGSGKTVGLAIRRLKELSFKGNIFTTTGLSISSDAITAAGDAIDGVYTLVFEFEMATEAKEFKDKYLKRFGEQPFSTSMLDYSSLEIIVAGIKNGGEEPLKISQYLHSVENLEVLTGNIEIQPSGDILSPIVIKQF